MPRNDKLVRDLHYVGGKPYTKYEVERLQSKINPYSSIDKEMIEVLKKISAALTGMRYCVVGRAAVAIYGRPIVTRNIDILIDISGASENVVVEALKKTGVSRDDVKYLMRGNHITVVKPQWKHRIYLIPAVDKAQIMQIENARKMNIMGVEISLSSPEELIAYLVLYGRPEDAAYLITNMKIDGKRLAIISSLLGVEKEVGELIRKVSQLKEEGSQYC